MKYRKITGIGFVCAVMLLTGATSVFATNDQNKQQEQAKETIETEKEEFSSYSIVKTEDGQQEVEKSGKVKATKTEDDTIILKILQDEEKTETVHVEFSPALDLKDGESGTYTCKMKDGSEYVLQAGDGRNFNISADNYVVKESGDGEKKKVTSRNGEAEAEYAKSSSFQDDNADDYYLVAD